MPIPSRAFDDDAHPDRGAPLDHTEHQITDRPGHGDTIKRRWPDAGPARSSAGIGNVRIAGRVPMPVIWDMLREPVEHLRVRQPVASGLAGEVRSLHAGELDILFLPGSRSMSCLGWPGQNCSSAGSMISRGVLIRAATSRPWYFCTSSANRSKRSARPYGWLLGTAPAGAHAHVIVLPGVRADPGARRLWG